MVAEDDDEIPVEVSVSGTTVSFNGVPTLYLEVPLSLDEVLVDRVTQQVAAMYAHGYVHRAGR